MLEADRESVLSTLLADAFDGDTAGLLRWLRLSFGKRIHHELPSAPSLAELAFQSMLVIQRNGRVDHALFEGLRVLRPSLGARIQEVARLWGIELTDAGSSLPASAIDDGVLGMHAHMPHESVAFTDEHTAETKVIPVLPGPIHPESLNSKSRTAPINSLARARNDVEAQWRVLGQRLRSSNPLARALDDALARKQRLEAASLPVEEVLAEIRTLKRELRRGGILRPGDVLGHHYLLIEQLGQGGFATVWRARDQRIGADVAVKVLHPNLAGDLERRQRFFRGARVMAELAHPAVVRIRVRKAKDDGFYYFIMDFVAGGNLHNAVLGQRLQREQIKSIILQVGAALAAAHKDGIVHRDVKPSNILLDYKGQPYLTDFDLVTAPDTTGGTRTGALGTFLYAPPEMMEHPQDADTRADVYGLGMTMAFMLHGEPLPHFSMREGSRFVRSLKCAAQLQSVLERAVAWKPEHRFADAGAFCQALREAMDAHAENDSLYRSSRKMTDLTSAQNQGHTEGQLLQWPSRFALRELLQNMRGGLPINYPILIDVDGPRSIAENTQDQKWEDNAGFSGSTEGADNDVTQPWLDYLVREYADHDVVLLKPKRPVPAPMLAVTIGRSRSCDITIKNTSVSSSHARILLNNSTSEYSLLDEDSRNGTFMNGDRISPHEHQRLWDGVMLFFGKVAFIFVTPSTLRELAGMAQ
jgi:serine/threonine protein kinase